MGTDPAGPAGVLSRWTGKPLGASMIRARYLPTSFVVIFLAALATVPGSAHADGPWALSLGAGPVDRYDYHTVSYSFLGDYHEGFGISGLVAVGTAYRLTEHASLRADIGYLRYGKTLDYGVVRPLSWSPGGPTHSSLTAQIPSVSAGIRIYPAGLSPLHPQLYVEAMPTLWLSHWTEQLVLGQNLGSFGNLYPVQIHVHEFTTVEPGFSAGFGFLGSLAGSTKLDLGFRYLFSSGLGRHYLESVGARDLDGLRQFALVMSVHQPL